MLLPTSRNIAGAALSPEPDSGAAAAGRRTLIALHHHSECRISEFVNIYTYIYIVIAQ